MVDTEAIIFELNEEVSRAIAPPATLEEAIEIMESFLIDAHHVLDALLADLKRQKSDFGT